MTIDFTDVSALEIEEDIFEFDDLGSQVDWRPEVPEAPGRFWRFEGHGWWDGSGKPVVYASLTMWKWYRSTPRGCWVLDEYFRVPGPDETGWYANRQRVLAESSKKLILPGTRKKWAYPTREEAWESFRIRTWHRVNHARNALEKAEAIRDMIARYDELRADKSKAPR